MSFTVMDVEQGSPEWRQARCGRLCASDAGAMLSQIKSGEAAARRDLRTTLVVERLTNVPAEDGFVSADMKRGKELEAAAVAAYEARVGLIVERAGFFAHASLRAGYSPDGVLAGSTGLLECKVPRSANHLRYLRSGGVPSEHLAQLTHALWLTGAEFIDFASYDPRFPVALQLFHVRMTRNEDAIADYERKALAFLEEVEREVESIRTTWDLPAVLNAALVA